MKPWMKLFFAVLLVLPAVAGAETVKLKATADIWLSNANAEEDNSSAGTADRFKLKSIQEMAAIRFDAEPAKGKEVLKARLLLHKASANMMRYVRVSTVNGDWAEGVGTANYGPGNGATYNHADFASKRAWSWPGSQFCDVIMGAGNTLDCWAERKEEADGWLSVEVKPELVYALVAGDSDGLAVMDGGNLGFENNLIHSVQSGANAPYLEVELGKALTGAPAAPSVTAAPAGERAHMDSGAIKVTIAEGKDVCCWKLSLGGKPVPRWQVKHPAATGATEFYLEDLKPAEKFELEVVAVALGGASSPPAKVSAESSAALSPALALGTFQKPAGGTPPPERAGKMKAWALPGLVKISPINGGPIFDDLDDKSDFRAANAVWDGKTVKLFGGRGEYVSYQICVENLGQGPLKDIKVEFDELKGAGGAIGATNIEMFRNWYARNRDKAWQPAYCVPLAAGTAFEIPDPQRKLSGQRNQTLYVDVYVPKDAKPGLYAGAVKLQAEGVPAFSIPVELTVLDLELPDKLAFWPELNAYNVPRNVQDYYRLAQQNRCVANFWRFAPQVSGSGKDMKVNWAGYDQQVGPLVSGAAFKNNRRAGLPLECMYLPFEDSWPTPLSPQTYNYQGHWPGRDEDKKFIIEHQMKVPYIGDALSADYKAAFLAVQRQFIEHFKEKGWDKTEMQCFYGGKNTHRTQYGVNMWWTTDEPYHWEDWLALQFFCRLWNQGREAASVQQWKARGDISRPQWQAKVLDHVVDTVYFGAGAFSSKSNYRRCRVLEQETGLKLMAYGSANADNASNTRSVVMIVNAYTNRANGILPWQTLGQESALDDNDGVSGGGNALLVPGTRFNLPVVADMRIKALRDGEQLAEYLALLAGKHNLEREQLATLVQKAMSFQAGTIAGASADNASALVFSTLKDWQIAELRRHLAEAIVKK